MGEEVAGPAGRRCVIVAAAPCCSARAPPPRVGPALRTPHRAHRARGPRAPRRRAPPRAADHDDDRRRAPGHPGAVDAVRHAAVRHGGGAPRLRPTRSWARSRSRWRCTAPPTPAQRIGSLVIDPGGPGGSGVNDLPAELSVLTSGTAGPFRHRGVRPPRGPAQQPGAVQHRDLGHRRRVDARAVARPRAEHHRRPAGAAHQRRRVRRRSASR